MKTNSFMPAQNQNNQIKKGVVVKLNSGGPGMTVQSVFEDSNGHIVARCAWFDNNGAVLTDKFVIESLSYVSG